MTATVRRADNDDEADLETIAAIVNASSPEWPTTVAEMQWPDAAYPGTVETGNDEANAAMRAVNARLGYRALPDEVTLRGSVAEAMMER